MYFLDIYDAYNFVSLNYIGGFYKGALGTHDPNPISFIFTQFSTNILPNDMLAPPSGNLFRKAC